MQEFDEKTGKPKMRDPVTSVSDSHANGHYVRQKILQLKVLNRGRGAIQLQPKEKSEPRTNLLTLQRRRSETATGSRGSMFPLTERSRFTIFGAKCEGLRKQLSFRTHEQIEYPQR